MTAVFIDVSRRRLVILTLIRNDRCWQNPSCFVRDIGCGLTLLVIWGVVRERGQLNEGSGGFSGDSEVNSRAGVRVYGASWRSPALPFFWAVRCYVYQVDLQPSRKVQLEADVWDVINNGLLATF